MARDFQADIDAVGRIAALPTILDVVCRTTGMGFAAVARVTADRWIACGLRDDIEFGLQPGGELRVETTICHEMRGGCEPVVINNVAEDPYYANHETPKLYGFASYISMPIILADGSFFGTLCAIDPKPACLNVPEIIGMFRLFADLIAFHLNATIKLAASAADLREAEQTARLREQFIAVLGHDLRNPLAAIAAGTEMLRRTRLDAQAAQLVTLIQGSVTRMSALIEDVLDFARVRLGGGLALATAPDTDLRPILEQVIAEHRATAPDRVIEASVDLEHPIQADHGRIAQLFSNLLGNALTHGAPDRPVTIRAATTASHFELAVANQGDQIPEADMQRLFHPFVRGAGRDGRQGLGLGLYIAAEIAGAHGGRLQASSTPAETRFTFTMPRLRPPAPQP